MAAVPPSPERRRPRPGSLERPVNAKLYRGTWLLVGLPLLVAAFSVARPTPLPAPEQLSALDGSSLKSLTADFVQNSNRYPGSLGADNAADWFREQLRPYGLQLRTERFSAVVPRIGRLHMQNLLAVSPGRSPQTIVVMAHRDNDGTGPGADDNGSGTAALVELARAYSVLTPAHTLVFLSTDGGTFGGLGAAEFLAHAPERHNVVAVINLDSIGGDGRPRLQIGGDTPRTTSGTLLETAAARIANESGRGPARPSVLRQLIDLGFPFNPWEQAPFISRGIPALTITTTDDRPPSQAADTADRLNATRLGQVARAAQDLLGTLDQGAEFVQGTSSYVYVGARVIRGWAIELVLMAMVLPFFAAAVDLFARCRRRRIALAPALRSYRSRLAFWVWTLLLFELFALLGLWPGGAARPPELRGSAATHWPAFGLLLLGVLMIAGWLVARERLLPTRPIRPEEELAGYTVALLCLCALALLVVATNPFALLFLLPSIHLWLWLPNLRRRPAWLRAAVVVGGFVGPALVIGSFAFRFGLGWDALWYVAELRSLGYVPFVAILLVVPWLAAAGQLVALTAGRYAPYPAADERPRLGPVRRVVRRMVMGSRARRRSTEPRRRALGG